MSCRATWETTALNLVGRPTTWYYTFYSAETQSLYFVTITPDGRVHGTQHLRRLSQPPPLLPEQDWIVDSQEALANWMNAGGGRFLGSRPGIEVSVRLGVRSNGGPLTWTVVGFDRSDRSYFAVNVAAIDGATVPVDTGTDRDEG